jgi:hypothetical protein
VAPSGVIQTKGASEISTNNSVDKRSERAAIGLEAAAECRSRLGEQQVQASRVALCFSFDQNIPRAPRTWRWFWDPRGKFLGPQTTCAESRNRGGDRRGPRSSIWQRAGTCHWRTSPKSPPQPHGLSRRGPSVLVRLCRHESAVPIGRQAG